MASSAPDDHHDHRDCGQDERKPRAPGHRAPRLAVEVVALRRRSGVFGAWCGADETNCVAGWEKVGYSRPATDGKDRGGGAPPTPPPRFDPQSLRRAPPRAWPSAAPSTTRSTRRTDSLCLPSSEPLSPTVSCWPRASTPASRSGGPATTTPTRRPCSASATRSRSEARQLTRFLAANAHDTELDSAGRVGVPDFLREHAGLNKEVVVAGAGDRLEVWDRGGLGRPERLPDPHRPRHRRGPGGVGEHPS